MQENKIEILLREGFSQGLMDALFDGIDKALVALFVDTLRNSLEQIKNAGEQQDSKDQLIAELHKIFQSSKYLGIERVADLIVDMKKEASENLNYFKDKLDIDLLNLQQIVLYWDNSLPESITTQLQDERAALVDYGREDAGLLRIYLELLINNMQEIREKIKRLKDEQNLTHLLSGLKENFVTLDIATNFMNYPELAAIIREWLITVGNSVDEDESIEVNSIIEIYNSFIDTLRVQFSTNDSIQTVCKKVELLAG
jgi:HPt (histidine-containing phosphotransfer) domain-containing protein